MTIHFKDGRALRREVEHPRGSPGNPLAREQLLAKYRACASRVLPPPRVERSIELLEALESLDRLADLVEALSSESLVGTPAR